MRRTSSIEFMNFLRIPLTRWCTIRWGREPSPVFPHSNRCVITPQTYHVHFRFTFIRREFRVMRTLWVV
jgi:hypothetical protein